MHSLSLHLLLNQCLLLLWLFTRFFLFCKAFQSLSSTSVVVNYYHLITITGLSNHVAV